MKKERSGRAKTVPSGLGSVESSHCSPASPDSVLEQGSSKLSLGQHPSHNTTLAVNTSTCNTPSTLKKTVNLLSPEVLTNWYANRKRENLYGPRRNSISNPFFNPDHNNRGHKCSPLVELRNSDKLRNSMLNLDQILLGEGVVPHHGSGKGIVRSESAKLTTNEGKLEVRDEACIPLH